MPLVYLPLTGDNEDTRWHPDNAGALFRAKVAKEVSKHFLVLNQPRWT